MTAKPPIVLVIEAAGGGAGKHLLDLAEGMHRLGHSLAVVYSPLRAEPVFLERLSALGCPVHSISMRLKPTAFLDWLALRRVLARYPGAWIHSHASRAGFLARLMAMGLPIRGHCYTPHGFASMNPIHGPWKRWLYGTMERWMAFRTQFVVCVSHSEQRHALKLGMTREQCVLIPNGIGPQAWAPREMARHRVGCFDPGVLLLGWIGRFVHEKALDHLIKIVASLPLHLPWHLCLVGDGPLRNEIAQACLDRGLSDRVTLAGTHAASDVLKGFDLFVFPSRSEAAPYAILEAMEAGLPIVGSDVGDISFMLGTAGVVLPSDNTALWRAALMDCMERPKQRERMGQDARRGVLSFSLEAMVRAHKNLYGTQSNRPSSSQGYL